VIDFRVVLASLASIFFALAVGVTLGAGPLRGDADEHLRAELRQMGAEQVTLRRQVERLERMARYHQAFASAVAPSLVKERLSGQRVVVVALPGADDATVTNVRGMLAAAGGTVTGTVRVSERWADPAQRQFLDELIKRLPARVADGASTYERAGSLAARALVTRSEDSSPTDEPRDSEQTPEPGQTPEETPGPEQVPDGEQAPATDSAGTDSAGTEGSSRPDKTAAMIIGALREGRLLQADATLSPADLAVVVAPARPGQGNEATEAWLALARALDQNSRGVVVAGGGASTRGLVADLRANAQVSAEVSTVDVADLTSGQVAVVWALVEQQHGGVGHYGAVEHTHGAAPKETPGPEPRESGTEEVGPGQAGRDQSSSEQTG
jgi:hypothetical protein